jgi:hypothetical protein
MEPLSKMVNPATSELEAEYPTATDTEIRDVLARAESGNTISSSALPPWSTECRLGEPRIREFVNNKLIHVPTA